MALTEGSLDSIDKAALIVMSMDNGVAGRVLKLMPDHEVQRIVQAVAAPKRLTIEDRLQVLTDFNALLSTQSFIREGGLTRARAMLEAAYGPELAEEMLRRFSQTLRTHPFEALSQVKPEDLFSLLDSENRQTAALILNYAPAFLSAKVLEMMPNERRVDIIRRMAVLENVRPDILHAVEDLVAERTSSFISFDYPPPQGIEAVVSILSQSERQVERDVIDDLQKEDPDLAEEIKSRMFMFDDLLGLRDEVLQRILREVDRGDLALGLRLCSDEVRTRIYDNMSERAAQELHDEIEDSPPVPKHDAENAQGRIVAKARAMEEAGEVDLSRNRSQEALV